MSSKTGGAVSSLGAGWGGPAHPAGPGEPPQLVALFVSLTIVITLAGWFLFWFLVQTRCGRRPLRRIQRGARRGLNMTIIQSLPLHAYDPTRRSAELMLLYRKRAAMMNVVDAPAAPQTGDGSPRTPTEASQDTIDVVQDAPTLSTQPSTELSPAVLPVEPVVGEEPQRSFADRIKTSFKLAGAVSRLTSPAPPTTIPLSTTHSSIVKTKQEPAVAHDPDTCVICLTSFEDGVTLRVLPCFHEFHPDCIDPWLLDLSARCPICKGNVAELLGCQPENDMGSEEVFYYADLRELFMGPVVSLWRTVQSRA